MRRLLLPAILVFHLCGTWSLPLIDRDEPRFAEASREMLERNDWIIPWFNGEHRFDKPPLIYWLQIASYGLFGINEFGARFPSAVCATLVAAVLLSFGRRLYGDRASLYAALLFSFSLQGILHAKAAVADMAMTLCFVLTLRAGWEVRQSGAPRWWGALVLALAGGFLAKGPVVWLAITPLLLSGPRWKTAGALVASLVIVAGWGVPAMLQTHGEFLRVGMGKHVVQRSFSALEGHGGGGIPGYLVLLPFYFVTIFGTFFPGSLTLPWLFFRMRREPLPGDSYLATSSLAVIGAFTLVSTKLPHYVLPAFPALALLLAGHWFAAGRRPWPLQRRLGIMAVAFTLIALVGFPLFARHFPSRELARQSAALLPADAAVAAIGYQEPSLVWYFQRRVEMLEASGLEEWMAKPGPRCCIVPEGTVASIPAALTVRGFNLVRGRKVALSLLIR